MKKPVKLKINCIYNLDANKIINYLGRTLSKKRPFVCIHKEIINKKEYFYFISGTSKTISEIKIKNFSKYFLKIEKGILNQLQKDTLFQTNLIYVIEYNNMSLFFCNYLGKLSFSEIDTLNKYIYNTFDNEIYLISF